MTYNFMYTWVTRYNSLYLFLKKMRHSKLRLSHQRLLSFYFYFVKGLISSQTEQGGSTKYMDHIHMEGITANLKYGVISPRGRVIKRI